MSYIGTLFVCPSCSCSPDNSTLLAISLVAAIEDVVRYSDIDMISLPLTTVLLLELEISLTPSWGVVADNRENTSVIVNVNQNEHY